MSLNPEELRKEAHKAMMTAREYKKKAEALNAAARVLEREKTGRKSVGRQKARS